MMVLNAELAAPASVEGLPTVYLFPGQLFTSSEASLVTTILGSCVAVCLWDPQVALGGINHYLLPADPLRSTSDLRYGNNAVEALIQEMVGRGASKHRMVAKIAGGASVIEGLSGKRSIGEQNIAVAQKVLQQHGISVTSEHTGGKRGRKLLFYTGNGAAFSKEI